MDHLSLYTNIPRSEWSNNLGNIFYVHILLASALIILSYFLYRLEKRKKEMVNASVKWTFYLVIFEFATGLVLYFFDISRYAQPFHLVFSTIILGVLSIVLVRSKLR